MTFSIEQFKAAIGSRGGLMRDNRFVVSMGIPKVMQGLDASFGLLPDLPDNVTAGLSAMDIARDLEFWAETIAVPGVQLATNAIKRWTYGPDEKRPFSQLYAPFVVQFNADANGDYIRYFNNWLQCIMPHDWYTTTARSRSNYGGRMWEVEYKSNYAVDITIAVLNVAGEIVETYILKEAFPSQISDIPMSYSSTNQNVKFVVNFEYLDWTTTTITPSAV